MKIIFKLTVVVFATMWWSCSSDESEVFDPANMSECQSRGFEEHSVIDLTDVEEAFMSDEMFELWEFYKAQQKSGIKKVNTTADDPYYFDNLLAIDGLPVTIKVREPNYSSVKRYLSCGGVNQIISLTETGDKIDNLFYIHVMPSISGGNCLIYSVRTGTPLVVGHRNGNQNDKVLMSHTVENPDNRYKFWNLHASPNHWGYFQIENSYCMDYIPSENGGYGQFIPLVLDAESKDYVSLKRPGENVGMQEFEICPVNTFEIFSVDYDVQSASVSNAKYSTRERTAINKTVMEKKFDFPINDLVEQSWFSTSYRALNVNFSGNPVVKRPMVSSGTVLPPDGSSVADAHILKDLSETLYRQEYIYSVNIPYRTKMTLSIKFKYYEVVVNYVAKARFTTTEGDTRYYTFKGKWSGTLYEDPKSDPPTCTYQTESLDEGGFVIGGLKNPFDTVFLDSTYLHP